MGKLYDHYLLKNQQCKYIWQWIMILEVCRIMSFKEVWALRVQSSIWCQFCKGVVISTRIMHRNCDMKFLFFNKWRMYQDPWGPTIGNLWFSRLGIYEVQHIGIYEVQVPGVWIYETKHLGIYDVQHLGIYVAQHLGIYETQDLGIYEAQHLGIYETQDLWGIWYRRFYDTVYSHAISTNFCSHFFY